MDHDRAERRWWVHDQEEGRQSVHQTNDHAACIFGAAFICVDVIVRLFPGKKGWRIQDSDTFLSLSLSLSFGVMVC